MATSCSTIRLSEQEFEKRGHDRPPSEIEKQVTYAKAKHSVEAVMQIGYALFKQLPHEEYPGLVADGWTTTAAVESEYRCLP